MPRAGVCRYCGASIYWARHAREVDGAIELGATMIIDAAKSERGNVALSTWRGQIIARVYSKPIEGAQGRLDHHVTCPKFKRDQNGHEE